MNNNKSDENAILSNCKGVFSKTSYISIGSKEKPESYEIKEEIRPNYKGKQFSTIPSKKGNSNDTFFEKKHNWIFDGDKYVDKLFYKELQKEKKKGFLTGDFNRKDEFSNSIRTEQYREQLKSEMKLTQNNILTSVDDVSINAKLEEKPMLYDLIFEKEDGPNFKCKKKEYKMGSLQTTTALAYNAPKEFLKPEYARKPIVRDSFYRNSCVFYPEGCAISAGD